MDFSSFSTARAEIKRILNLPLDSLTPKQAIARINNLIRYLKEESIIAQFDCGAEDACKHDQKLPDQTADLDKIQASANKDYAVVDLEKSMEYFRELLNKLTRPDKRTTLINKMVSEIDGLKETNLMVKIFRVETAILALTQGRANSLEPHADGTEPDLTDLTQDLELALAELQPSLARNNDWLKQINNFPAWLAPEKCTFMDNNKPYMEVSYCADNAARYRIVIDEIREANIVVREAQAQLLGERMFREIGGYTFAQCLDNIENIQDKTLRAFGEQKFCDAAYRDVVISHDGTVSPNDINDVIANIEDIISFDPWIVEALSEFSAPM